MHKTNDNNSDGPMLARCEQNTGFVANSKYKIQALFEYFSMTQTAFFKHQNFPQKAVS